MTYGWSDRNELDNDYNICEKLACNSNEFLSDILKF